ncbi:MAG: response regulator transcription factor [Acidimicrobiales bacterium]
MRVLIVEDEPDLAEAIARGLRREGYAVDLADRGDDALERLSMTPYDLVCLDLSLPGVDGVDICREVRAGRAGPSDTRVLMLTARDGIGERVTGLDVGADDYLVKPFAFAELAARIRSLLRRDVRPGSAVQRIGDLEIDAARHEASHRDRRLDLTAKEFALLRYFAAHPGEVLSQERLLDHVWDEHADPFTHTVRVTVGNLRRKLAAAREPSEPPLIETVVGAGYRLRP